MKRQQSACQRAGDLPTLSLCPTPSLFRHWNKRVGRQTAAAACRPRTDFSCSVPLFGCDHLFYSVTSPAAQVPLQTSFYTRSKGGPGDRREGLSKHPQPSVTGKMSLFPSPHVFVSPQDTPAALHGNRPESCREQVAPSVDCLHRWWRSSKS